MIYKSAQDWLDAPEKRVLLFGMSGLGKTYLANMLRAGGDWYHYSVDYRIGTRYLGEDITDNFKRAAMRVPLLREMLMTDSVYIGSNITFNNLKPLSAYLGKPGDPARGGLGYDEYRRRQGLHRDAEIAALLDTPHFIDRARDIYGYPHFICDSSGSICEVVDPDNPDDAVLKTLRDTVLMVWIEGSDDHAQELIRRFDKAPKPMYYNPQFLERSWNAYLRENNVVQDDVDPDDFVRWTYAQALRARHPRYGAIARNWGVRVGADAVARVKTEHDFLSLVATALEAG